MVSCNGRIYLLWFLVIIIRQKVSWGAVTHTNTHKVGNTQSTVKVQFPSAHLSPFDLHNIYSTNDCWCRTPQRRLYNGCLKPKQRRLDSMAIRRQISANQRLARQRQQKHWQQQARDQICQARAEMTQEQLDFWQQQD